MLEAARASRKGRAVATLGGARVPLDQVEGVRTHPQPTPSFHLSAVERWVSVRSLALASGLYS